MPDSKRFFLALDREDGVEFQRALDDRVRTLTERLNRESVDPELKEVYQKRLEQAERIRKSLCDQMYDQEYKR